MDCRAGVFILLELISGWLSDVQADWQQFEESKAQTLVGFQRQTGNQQDTQGRGENS